MSDIIEKLERRIERKRQEELSDSVEDVPDDISKLGKLCVLLEAARFQAEMIPDPPNTRSRRDWLTANQKEWVLRYLNDALSLLGEENYATT